MLSDDADPMVTVMKLDKAPQETYADIGGLDAQIQEIKVRLNETHARFESLPVFTIDKIYKKVSSFERQQGEVTFIIFLPSMNIYIYIYVCPYASTTPPTHTHTHTQYLATKYLFYTVYSK